MKIRSGFVSNSSSSSFILDIRNKEVKELIKDYSNELREPVGVGRGSAMAIGKDVLDYANEWNAENEFDEYEDQFPSYGQWIIENIEKLGVENTVFVRISDEDNFSYIQIPEELIVSEREYH